VILAYLRQRFPPTFFGPLAVILAACALGRRATVGELATTAALAALLLAQFRIWDDVADRSRDAITHPERVTVQAKGHTSLLAFGTALLILNVAAAGRREVTSVLLLAVLHIALAGYYLLRTGRTMLGDQLLLAKYPAFVFILAGERLLSAPVAVTVTAAIVYAAASAYEAWHDRVSPLAQLLGGRS
jgi:hypothetical protein